MTTTTTTTALTASTGASTLKKHYDMPNTVKLNELREKSKSSATLTERCQVTSNRLAHFIFFTIHNTTVHLPLNPPISPIKLYFKF